MRRLDATLFIYARQAPPTIYHDELQYSVMMPAQAAALCRDFAGEQPCAGAKNAASAMQGFRNKPLPAMTRRHFCGLEVSAPCPDAIS